MKLKDRIKTYNFWVSLSSAIFLLLKLLGHQFGFTVDESLFSDLITSLCGILVILGIIVPPSSKSTNNENVSICQITEDNLTSQDSQIVENYSLSNKESLNNSIIEDCFFSSENLESVNNSQELALTNNSDSEELINDNSQIINNSGISEDISLENDIEKTIQNGNNTDLESIKSNIAKTLADQEKLLNGNYNLYIELLQNQINLIRNK